MTRKKRYLITTETHRITVIRNSVDATQIFCPACGETVNTLPVAAVPVLTGLTEAEIGGLTESGALHMFESGTGQPRFCRRSLSARAL